MDRNDQQAIDSLFQKLADAERQAPPRDADAERYIRDQLSRMPGAAYLMAQTVIVQDHALTSAQTTIEDLQRRIEDFERQQAAPREPEPAPAPAPSSGGFLSGLFGDKGNSARPAGAVPSIGRQQPGPASAPLPSDAQPYGTQPTGAPPTQAPWSRAMGGGGGGGFLAGAAQTAMGVAGGVLLGNMIGGMFGGHGGTAQAAEAVKPETLATQPEPQHDTAQKDDQDRTDTQRDDPQPDDRQADAGNDQQGGYEPGDSGLQDADYDDQGDFDPGFGDDFDV